jgi:hypothetical protein
MSDIEFLEIAPGNLKMRADVPHLGYRPVSDSLKPLYLVYLRFATISGESGQGYFMNQIPRVLIVEKSNF